MEKVLAKVLASLVDCTLGCDTLSRGGVFAVYILTIFVSFGNEFLKALPTLVRTVVLRNKRFKKMGSLNMLK